jgi:hypothetical protein
MTPDEEAAGREIWRLMDEARDKRLSGDPEHLASISEDDIGAAPLSEQIADQASSIESEK